MRTARFGGHHETSVPIGEGVGPQVKTFEQVFSDDHQISVAGEGEGIQDPFPMQGGRGVGIKTDTYKNITFLQLRSRPITIN